MSKPDPTHEAPDLSGHPRAGDVRRFATGEALVLAPLPVPLNTHPDTSLEVGRGQVLAPFILTAGGARIRAVSGAVAQLGERSNRTAEVRGSTPLGSTRHHPAGRLNQACPTGPPREAAFFV